MSLLSKVEVYKQLKLLDGWSLNNNTIKKEYIFDSYMDSIRFINLLAKKAEENNHHPDLVVGLTERLNNIGVQIVALSDTIGVSHPRNIAPLFKTLIIEYPYIEFGAHFHTTKESWKEKLEAAYQNGCRRFDGTLKGYGGCPMANDDLVGNMPTEELIAYFQEDLNYNFDELQRSLILSSETF